MDTTLANLPAVERTTAVNRLIELAGAKVAEQSLVELASQEGDVSIAQIVKEMRPIDANKILREFDYTTGSIITSVIHPVKIAEVLKTEASFWSNSYDEESLRSTQEQAASLLCSIVLGTNDQERRGLILTAIISTDCGELFLKFVFSGRLKFVHFVQTGSFDLDSQSSDEEEEVTIGDWKELAFAIKSFLPNYLEQLLEELEIDHNEHLTTGLMQRDYIVRLKGIALENPDLVVEKSEFDELFVPL